MMSGYLPLSYVYAVMSKQVVQIVLYDESTSATTKSNFPYQVGLPQTNNSLKNVLTKGAQQGGGEGLQCA